MGLCQEGYSTCSRSGYSRSLTRLKVKLLHARLASREKLCSGAERGKACSTVLCLRLFEENCSVMLSFFLRLKFMYVRPNSFQHLQGGQMLLAPNV